MEAYPFPVSTREAAYNSLEITSTDGYDWSPFGKERRDELKMIENSTFYYQLKTNGYTHAWKEMYIKVNAQCNAIGIPYKKRLSLYLKEIEYLSLLLHDTLPSNYSKQGIAPGDISISSHHTFFSPKDSITVVCRKWYDFLGQDYEDFWDVYSNKIDFDR